MTHSKTYLLYSKAYKFYKIGRAKWVDDRLITIRKMHKDAELVCVMDNDIERVLHLYFRSKKVVMGSEREWYCLNEMDVFIIKSLSKLTKKELEVMVYADMCYEDWQNKVDNRYTLKGIRKNLENYNWVK